MSEKIFDEVDQIASTMGSCDPLWLKNRQEPEFTIFPEGDSGPEILLLHGLFGALSNWESTMPEMAKFAQPRAISFPITTGHRSEVKVKALAAYTAYYAKQQGYTPTILCGNSLGGHVALRLSLAAPEMVSCLILSGASGLYEHSVDTLPVRPGAEFVREHMKRVFYNQEFVTEEAIGEIAGILESKMRTLNLIHAARSAKKDNLLDRLKEIQVPTLLLWGEDDLVTTMDVAETFHKHIPNSKLVTIKNCGHAPMIEYPVWFAEEVKKFLADNGKL